MFDVYISERLGSAAFSLYSPACKMMRSDVCTTRPKKRESDSLLNQVPGRQTLQTMSRARKQSALNRRPHPRQGLSVCQRSRRWVGEHGELTNPTAQPPPMINDAWKRPRGEEGSSS
jgi:hypothetical protein